MRNGSCDVIQGLWVGGPITVMEKMSMLSFLGHGHQYDLWTYSSLDGVPAGVNVRDANEIIPVSRVFKSYGYDGKFESWAGFSDMFRYKLLRDRGGWWVDTDFVCLKPFEFPNPYVFTGDPGENISPGLLKVPFGDPMMECVYQKAALLYAPNMRWGLLSGLIEAGVKEFNLAKFKVDADFFAATKAEIIAPVPKPSVLARMGNAYAVHLSNEAWRAECTDKEKGFYSDSLYAKLLREYGLW